jgi:hypothetical protein
MADPQRADAIRGKTIRLTWMDGPTKGKTHEHVFHEDGTVEWRDADATAKAPESKTADPGPAGRERPPYAAMKVTDEVYVVSYLAASGYTLTVVLNFRNQQTAGFASSAKEWYPIQGRFEVVR